MKKITDLHTFQSRYAVRRRRNVEADKPRHSEVFAYDNPQSSHAPDDDPDTREMIKLLLGAEGYEVTTLDSPEDVLRLAETQGFALFLLGIVGCQACQETN